MFKVTFNVSDSNLASVMTALDGLVSVKATHCEDAGEIAVNAARTAKARRVSAAKKRATKKTPRLPAQRTPLKREKALDLIRSVGLRPFRANEIVKLGAKSGIAKPQVYNAIYSEMKAGNLKKLEIGLYQKTASGALGTAANA